MKNSKKLILILLIIFILLSILFFIFIKNTDISIEEYTPQEEISESDIRKTIIYLYFKNIETNSLIAEAKCIDAKDLFENPYEYIVNMLIYGPESDKLESAIPENTRVNSCKLVNDTVYVDFSKEFIDNAPTGKSEENLIIASIVNSLTELNEVNSVKFLINGEENLSFNDKQISFENVFFRNN